MTEKDKMLPVTEIQRFCMHDGTGVRTVVFLKGCPLHCAWCHNPETQAAGAEMLYYPQKCIGCGACVSACPTGAHILTAEGHGFDREACDGCVACASPLCAAVCCTEAITPAASPMAVADILAAVERDRAFYGESIPRADGQSRTFGGLTVSGGEPMAHPAGTLALLEAARTAGLSTAVETCGQFDPAYLARLVGVSDLLLWDVKDTDPARHKAYTGVGNERILQNLREAARLAATSGCRIRLRCILVSGVNTGLAHYEALAALATDLAAAPGVLEGVEFLPYHAYSGSKMLPLGLPDNGRVDWIPHTEDMEAAKQLLQARGIPVIG